MTKIVTNNIYVSNNTFSNNQLITAIDCNFTPWINNSIANAFYNCSNLSSITNLNNNITDATSAFASCTNLETTPTIPNSVKNISQAFQDCTNLKMVTKISDSITNMYSTFKNCTNLANNIYIYSSNITNAINCFDGTSLRKNVYIPFEGKELNGNVYGTLNNTCYVYSNFTTSNYIYLNTGVFSPGTNNWEYKTSCIWNGNYVGLVIAADADYQGFRLQIGNTSGTLGDAVLLVGTGYTWLNYGGGIQNIINAGTKYYFKINFDNSTHCYTTSISEDDINYTEIVNLYSDGYIGYSGTHPTIGSGAVAAGEGTWFRDSIDMNDTYFKVGDTITWRGLNAIPSNTYNSFINAGYDENGTLNGVYLKTFYDIDDQEYIATFNEMNTSTNTAAIAYLNEYIGLSKDIVVPIGKMQG